MSSAAFKKIASALFGAIALVGIAFITCTPPFDGIDESAHYSRIISTAYVLQPPFAAQKAGVPPYDRLVAELDDYHDIAPLQDHRLFLRVPHSEEIDHATPEFDGITERMDTKQSDEWHSYLRFFSEPSRVAEYVKRYRNTPAQEGYVPGRLPNWEYQHPPLYYYLFAPVAWATADFSLVDRLVIMRLVNFLLVLAALAIGVWATHSYLTKTWDIVTARSITLWSMLFPFIFSCFWIEFFRLGNDNLCAFIVAMLWALLLKHLEQPNRASLWVLLGIVSGLGWLVKFTMIAVSVGIFGFLFVRNFSGDANLPAIRQKNISLMTIVGSSIVIGGSWYFFIHFSGQSHGSLEVTWLLHNKNLWNDFHKYMTAPIFAHAFIWLVETTAFSSNIEYLGDVTYFMAAAVVLAYFNFLVRAKKDAIPWLALWLIAPTFAVLLLHMAYCIVELHGYILTSGRYAFILLPAFLTITGVGGVETVHSKNFKAIAFGILLMTPVIISIIFWYRLDLFGGCAEQYPAVDGYMSLGPAYCLDRFGQILKNVDVLAWMKISLVCFVSGWLLLVYAVGKLFGFSLSDMDAASAATDRQGGVR